MAVLAWSAHHPDAVVLDQEVVVGRGDVDAAALDRGAIRGVQRQERPGLVPWTMWGICVPVTRGTQCGQLLLDEWRDIMGAPALFTLLQAYRNDARVHPDK